MWRFIDLNALKIWMNVKHDIYLKDENEGEWRWSRVAQTNQKINNNFFNYFKKKSTDMIFSYLQFTFITVHNEYTHNIDFPNFNFFK